ncbi:MAG: purine-nucleoside phosphorylase [Actinomycetota bacterium]|nr:purine-nucleoside phosphorylase [Actinomycetota bacterium]
MDPVEQFKNQVRESTHFVRERIEVKPLIGIVLGSGLGGLVDEIKDKKIIPYRDIPHFPIPMTPGHSGNLVSGKFEGKEVIVMQGRPHYYEGYTMKGITLPIRVFKELGVEILILSNAAGGLNPDFDVRDFMIITDHINLMGTNPLIGLNDPELGPRFLDMSQAYDRKLIEIAQKVAREEGIRLHKGVYVGVPGPSYETPAEIEFLARIGANAVGMSTVPEAIVANHAGLRVLGISCITDVVSDKKKVTHEEVLVQAQKTEVNLRKLIKGIVRKVVEG